MIVALQVDSSQIAFELYSKHTQDEQIVPDSVFELPLTAEQGVPCGGVHQRSRIGAPVGPLDQASLDIQGLDPNEFLS